MVEAERNAAREIADVPIVQAELTKESSNIYHQLDQTARGFIAERK
jgi:hypothetical protein